MPPPLDLHTFLDIRFLRTCERKLEALQSSLATLETNHPDVAQHIRSESEAREALSVALARLERFDSMFGSGSVLPPDQQVMAQQLREKDELLRVANIQRRQEQVVRVFPAPTSHVL